MLQSKSDCYLQFDPPSDVCSEPIVKKNSLFQTKNGSEVTQIIDNSSLLQLPASDILIKLWPTYFDQGYLYFPQLLNREHVIDTGNEILTCLAKMGYIDLIPPATADSIQSRPFPPYRSLVKQGWTIEVKGGNAITGSTMNGFGASESEMALLWKQVARDELHVRDVTRSKYIHF